MAGNGQARRLTTASQLSGRVVVVTGAGGTAGTAVVNRLAARGAFVVAVDAEESRLAPLVESVLEAGGRCAARAVDLVDEATTYSWASSLVDQCDHIDGLIHLVGGADGVPDIDASASDWDWMQQLVIRTLQNVSLALREQLRAGDRGRLALVSVAAATEPTTRNAYYAAARAAAEAWVLSMADYFRGTPAAATILTLPAAVSAVGETAAHDRVDGSLLAGWVEGLWEQPATELNGVRMPLRATERPSPAADTPRASHDLRAVRGSLDG